MRYLQCDYVTDYQTIYLNIIIRLHKNTKIKVKIGSVDSKIESSIWVRQGSCEGPVLFLFIMEATLETMKWPVPKPVFCTRKNGVTMGERTERKRGTVKHEHGCSLYADDVVFFFNTRERILKKVPAVYAHLLHFGLTMHIGFGTTPSKTEAMFFPPPRRLYSKAKTSRLNVLDGTGNAIGFIDFTTEFKNLGSIDHHSLTSDADFDKRIRSASAAFGALKSILTNKDIDPKVKGSVYVALCLSFLLYGSEIWYLREDLFNHLRHFHHRCARTMCALPLLKNSPPYFIRQPL
jgi:hypothetical protein